MTSDDRAKIDAMLAAIEQIAIDLQNFVDIVTDAVAEIDDDAPA